MVDTYAKHADVCVKFYELTLPAAKTANFIFENAKAVAGQKALFVGGMFHLAKALGELGLDITVVDYTDEMVQIGQSLLRPLEVTKADLRSLPFNVRFDIVFVVGRVFTHMLNDADLNLALGSCRRALKDSGVLFFDNYESSKIQKTNYFNGVVHCEDGSTEITRNSSTTFLSRTPHLVRWDAEYKGQLHGKEFHFRDSLAHRAFSRDEVVGYLSEHRFKVSAQGDNFDETSFFTRAMAE